MRILALTQKLVKNRHKVYNNNNNNMMEEEKICNKITAWTTLNWGEKISSDDSWLHRCN